MTDTHKELKYVTSHGALGNKLPNIQLVKSHDYIWKIMPENLTNQNLQ